ncbi:hypothetical protein [uncultured Gemella sp.]|uniref:hypothetical protein n=1 Tax=uncultured Gemella sp. TaxID=254352 RepID=UPI0028D48BE0|nr:hypothetical protein [uncultured Gemella sp.]
MKKNKKLLVGLLSVVIMSVIGLSAYAYQKYQIAPNKFIINKSKSKLEKIITESKSKFDKENDFNKKLNVLKELQGYKDEVAAENKDKVRNDFEKTVKEMREKLSNDLKDKINKLTLNDADKKDNAKVEKAKKELSDLQSLINENKNVLFEKQRDLNEILEVLTKALTNVGSQVSQETKQNIERGRTDSNAPVANTNNNTNNNNSNSNATNNTRRDNSNTNSNSNNSNSNANNTNNSNTNTNANTNTSNTNTNSNSNSTPTPAPAETPAAPANPTPTPAPAETPAAPANPTPTPTPAETPAAPANPAPSAPGA